MEKKVETTFLDFRVRVEVSGRGLISKSCHGSRWLQPVFQCHLLYVAYVESSAQWSICCLC